MPLMLQMKHWRSAMHHLDMFVANSDAVRLHLEAEGFDPVEVIRHGVRVHPAGPPLAVAPTVVFAGRLVREKGADVLLRAFAEVSKKVPEARLVIAGDGPESDTLKALMSDLDVTSRVTMPGHVPHAELIDHFGGAWVQVVPSLWAEPLGIVAIEAMMRGTAVVASDSGGLREIVEHERTGFLTPPGNERALAHALEIIMSDRRRTEQMGQAGRRRALDVFNEDKVTDRMVQLYERLADTQTAAAALSK